MTRKVRSTAKGVWRTNSQETMRTKSERQEEADHRRHEDGANGLQKAGPDDGSRRRCLAKARTDEAADQRMRGA
ncbi:hypothetical protein [Ensifer canadensis]